MVIKTKSLSDVPSIDDGLRIMITRTWARGKTWSDLCVDLKIKELAPSSKLLKQFKENKLEWSDFMDIFKLEIKYSFHAQRWIKFLRKLADRFTLTLLCFEPEGKWCHRYFIRDLLNEADI